MFSFMKQKDKKEKEEKKREKKEKKEREKKEKNCEPVTQDELKRLEEVKKGVFRRFSTRNTVTEGIDGMKKDSSDSSLSDGQPSPIRECPPADDNNHLRSSSERIAHPSQRKPPPAIKPKPRGILKSGGDLDTNIGSNIDDRNILQENTRLNQSIFSGGKCQALSKKPQPVPRGGPKREAVYGDIVEENLPPPTSPVPTEKSFNAKLGLPEIAPIKQPRIRELVIKRQVAGDFGFTLRKGIMSENESSGTENKKSVIFAEPGDYSRSLQTGLIPGDRLLEVGGIIVENMPREEIVEILKNCGDNVTLKVQPIPELVELSVRPSSEGGLVDVQESMAKGGTLKRSGSKRYKKGARSETAVESEKAWLDTERVWLVHKGGFASACVLKIDATSPLPEGRVRIKLDHGGDILEVDEDDVEKANPPQYERAEDLASLRHLNESSVLHTLRQRYGANLTHTYTGQSMVIVNPMQQLSIYSEKVIRMFKGCKQEDMPPHIFAAAQITYREMVNSRSDQSIVLMGRSGSGKSTNSKHILHYLTLTAGNVGDALTVDKLNAVLILLDAFGNSKTILNTNASRFAQITTLDFDHSGQIASASIQALSFEKTRIVRRPEGEPTFHIFYQMLAGLDLQLRSELQLTALDEPNLFMTPLQRNEDRQRAAQTWSMVMKSFEIVGVVEEEVKAICAVLAAVYHLGVAGAIKGNNNKSQFAHPAASQKAAALLGISVEELTRQIFTSAGSGSLTRTTSMRVNSPRDVGFEGNMSAIENLEGFVIGLYSDVFNAVVSLINRSLSSNYRAATSITVVDPPGFQNPATCGRLSGASFEDLCNNYMQERLQLFNHDLTFTVQQDRYSQENIECDFEFVTSSPTALVALIDRPSQQTLVRNANLDLDSDKKGLLWILDEEAIFPGATEDSFMDRFFTHHGEPKVGRDSLLRKASSLGNTFILNHFQGTNPVQYNASGWLKICRENPSTRVATQVLQESKKPNISQLFNSVKAPVAGMVSGSIAGMEGSTTLRRVGSMRRTFMSGTAGLKKRSACLQVKFQVDSMIETIRKTKCHFIHCILPQHNGGLCDLRAIAVEQGKSEPTDENLMNVSLVRLQLRGSEILDSIRIYRQGFPDFMAFGEFRQRFQGLIASNRPSEDMTDKQAMGHLLEHLDIDKLNHRIGLSRVFFRAGALNQLELARDEKITGTVVGFQGYCRGFLGRKNLEKLRVKQLAVSCIQRNVQKFVQIRDWEWWKLFTKVKPLLNVHRTEEELQEKEEELEQLKARLEKIEKERNEYKLQCDRLDNKLSEMTADYSEVHTASNQTGELLESEQAERMRLEKELKDIQGKYNALKRHSDKQEIQVMQMHLWQAQADGELEEDDVDGSDSVYKERYEKILREMDFTKKRMQHQYEEQLEQEETNKKTLEKRIHDAIGDAEEQRRLVMSSKKKSQRLAAEMQDMKLHLEEQMTRNNDLERKQRRFDSELTKCHEETRSEKSLKEKLQREKDELMSEKISLDENVERLKMDVELYSEKAERFDRELCDLTMTGTKDDHEVLALKRAKTELEMKNKDQEEELDEQAGQIQQLDQTKLRLEMNIEKSRQQHLKELEEKEEELEDMRTSTQKKLKQLNAQLEEEYEEKKCLITEKRDFERQLQNIGGQHLTRDKEVEKRLRRDLRKTKALLRDAELMLQKQRTGAGTKTTIKQLRNQLDDSEYASAAATKARKAMELEIQDIQQQLEDVFRVKQESENKSMALLREKTDLQSQLEENEEDMAELMKKFKSVVAQQSLDHIATSDQLQQLEELQQERDKLKQEVAELSSRVLNFEESSVDKHTVTRLENKLRDMEVKLDLEETTKHRAEVQLARLKEQMEKISEEKEHLVSSKTQADETTKKNQRQLRDMREDFSDMQKREMEMVHKNKELENKVNELEGDFEQNQSDLKLAFRRISDLQSALEDDLDSGSLLSDSDDDLDDDDDLDSDIDSLLESHKQSPRLQHRGRDSSSPMSPLSNESFDAEPSGHSLNRTGSS